MLLKVDSSEHCGVGRVTVVYQLQRLLLGKHLWEVCYHAPKQHILVTQLGASTVNLVHL